jgi:tetratricopeptide (TPR) repeat protein
MRTADTRPGDLESPDERKQSGDVRSETHDKEIARLRDTMSALLKAHAELLRTVRDCQDEVVTLQPQYNRLTVEVRLAEQQVYQGQASLQSVVSRRQQEEQNSGDKRNDALIQQLLANEANLQRQISLVQSRGAALVTNLQTVGGKLEAALNEGRRATASLQSQRNQCGGLITPTVRDDLIRDRIAILNEALASSPDFVECLIFRASLLAFDGDESGAIADLSQAEPLLLKPHPGVSPMVAVDFVYVSLLVGRGQQSRKLIRFIEKTWPNEPAVQHIRALCEANQNNFSTAASSFRRALQAEQSIDRSQLCGDAAWFFAASPVENSRNPTRARDCAEEALRLTGGKSWQSWRAMAALHADDGDWDKASECMDRVFSEGPKVLHREFDQQAASYKAHEPYRIMRVGTQ